MSYIKLYETSKILYHRKEFCKKKHNQISVILHNTLCLLVNLCKDQVILRMSIIKKYMKDYILSWEQIMLCNKYKCFAGLEKPTFDMRCKIYELDPCDGYGKVCLVYKENKTGWYTCTS